MKKPRGSLRSPLGLVDCLGLIAFAAATAVAAAAATSTAAAVAAATTSTASATTAAAAATAAIFAWARFIHGELAAIDVLIVQSLDRPLAFLAAAHFHEPETFGSAGIAIDDDLHGQNRPVLLEQTLQIRVGHAVRQITDIQLHSHGGTP
jgi:hypothetical protein